MVMSVSASVELRGNNGVETGPSVAGVPDPDGIDEGSVAESGTSDRVPRRAVVAARAESDPARVSLSGWPPSPTAGIRSALGLSEAAPASEAVSKSEEKVTEESASEPAKPPPRPRLPRAPRAVLRAGDGVEAPAGADAESEAFDPVEPAEPVVSAKATGIAPMAEPTPSATAKAPTRPTYRA